MSQKILTDTNDHVIPIASNSFWNVINYITTGLVGFLITVLLARSFGPDQYGVYSLFTTIVVVGAIILDLGIGQVTFKYIPRYFNDEENKGLSVIIFYRTLSFQLILAVILSLIALALSPILLRYINFGHTDTGYLLVIAILSLIPSTVSKQFTNFLSATLNTKKIAIANLIVQAINITLIIIFSLVYKNLVLILFSQLIVYLILSLILYIYLVPLLKYNQKPQKVLDFKDIRNFAFLAYVNVILTFVVWSYSEIFFLTHYSSIKEVGFYSLAFFLASILSSIPGLYLRNAFNVQFELLEKGEDERVDQMSSRNVKLMSVIFLPLAVLIVYFSSDVINLIYGVNYTKVAIILPLVLFGTIISTTIGSPIFRANNHNKVFGKTVVITLIGALVNISLDYLLIPRFASIGAGWANFISQILLTFVLVFYVFRVLKIKIDWLKVIKVYGLNVVLAIFLFGGSLISSFIIFKILIFMLGLYLYTWLLIGFNIFDHVDALILEKITAYSPKFISSSLSFLAKLFPTKAQGK